MHTAAWRSKKATLQFYNVRRTAAAELVICRPKNQERTQKSERQYDVVVTCMNLIKVKRNREL